MANLIITIEGGDSRMIPLAKDKFTIGRARHNDLVIDHAGISAEHADIVTTVSDAFLQDLGSTNGTKINGQPVKKHYLQNGDVIEIAHCAIGFRREANSEHNFSIGIGESRTLFSQGRDWQTPMQAERAAKETGRAAIIKILNGRRQGKVLALNNWLTTIGYQDGMVATIIRCKGYYSMGLVDGRDRLYINGQSTKAEWPQLRHGDAMELNGTRMRFEYLESV